MIKKKSAAGPQGSCDIRYICPNKRKQLSPEEAANLQRCLATTTTAQEAVRNVWNIASELRPEAPKASHSVTVSLDSERLNAFWRCYSAVELQMVDEEDSPESIYILQIRQALLCLCNRSSMWREQVKAAINNGGVLTPIIYSDEVHSGNILSGRAVKKLTAWYMSFREFRHGHDREYFWLPLAFAQVEFSERIQGGISAITAHILDAVYMSLLSLWWHPA